jgi:hypothetical protein
MREIIQGASIIPVTEHEKSGFGQMAPLDVPQRLWGRPGWRESLPKSSFLTGKNHSAHDPIAQDAPASAKRPRKKKKTVRMTTPRARSPVVEIPMAPTTLDLGTIRPVALEQRGVHLNEDNGDHEPVMTNQISQSQEPQDMSGD